MPVKAFEEMMGVDAGEGAGEGADEVVVVRAVVGMAKCNNGTRANGTVHHSLSTAQHCNMALRAPRL